MKRLTLVFLSAVLAILSFPPHDLGFLAWISLVPLFQSIRGERPLKSFLYCWLFGTSMTMGVYYWIAVIKGFSVVYILLLTSFYGLFYGFFGLLLNRTVRIFRWSPVLAASIIWVAVEYFRSNAGFLALPWPNLGNAQYRYLSVIQVASFTGIYGVSFLVVMVNAATSELLRRFAIDRKVIDRGNFPGVLKPAAVALLCLVSALSYGRYVTSRNGGPEKVTVAVIQGNIPQNQKWDPKHRAEILSKHLRLSEAACENGGVSLIAWPETAVPGSLPADPVLSRAYSELSAKTGAHFLVGSAQVPKMRMRGGRVRIEKMYNCTFLFSPDGKISEPYRKIRLLPFGEYLPYRGRLPWPSGIDKALETDFSPGIAHKVFSLYGVPFCTPVCWESNFPELFRGFVKNGARFAVNLTNEAWFGETAAPYQFLAMNVFRAVENRIPVVRSANTGVSCFIDPRGEIYGKVESDGKDIFVEGFSVQAVELRNETTFYTRHGDLFALCNVLLTFFAALGSSILADRNADDPEGRFA